MLKITVYECSPASETLAKIYMLRAIHPFPARMAPDVALEKLSGLPEDSVVLDPMSGSGTVVRQALELGHRAIGVDLDPLAVLMSRVWATPFREHVTADVAAELRKLVVRANARRRHLAWIDDDTETSDFISFWFAEPQRADLRSIAYAIHTMRNSGPSKTESAALDLLGLALSRTIVTKERGASLGRDVSHSRPHRVMLQNDFSVSDGFERAIADICRRLAERPLKNSAKVMNGDARAMTNIKSSTIDAVLTSPPYLNAIDYMRGHRLALVWLGHRLKELRHIRTVSIGSERSAESELSSVAAIEVRAAMGDLSALPRKFSRMVDRYVQDLTVMLAEIARVLKTRGTAVFVVGDSCVRGTFVRNSEAVAEAARQAGLVLLEKSERDLPVGSRYLPLTSEQLSKRMRKEAVLSFAAP